MIADLRLAAEAVGITAIITNSNEKIETQLNRITGVEDLPIMLISWDLETSLEFNEHGFLNNPVTNVVLLLMDKPEDRTKDVAESTAESMAVLYQQFMQALYSQLIQYQKVQGQDMLTGISYTLVPQHGLGKHAGVMGRFTMQTAIVEDCIEATTTGETTGGGDDGTTDPELEGYAIKYDLDNNGLGEIRNDGDGTLSQQSFNVLGDFKVRTGQFGTFTETPTSLEAVEVFSYDYDKNSGNPGGWSPIVDPDLEGSYYHFSAGVSQTANDRIIQLAIDRELGITSTTDLTVYREDSSTDWAPGMSVYKDVSGTPIMDGVTSPWDRYHFIDVDSNNEIILVRSTDSIVTHVEYATSNLHLKYMEMYSFSIVTDPLESAPRLFADYLLWFDEKVNDPSSTLNYNSTRPTEYSKRRMIIDYSNGSMATIGDSVKKRNHGWNAGQALYQDITGIELDPEAEGTIYQLGTTAITVDGINFLIREIDFTTGLVTNFQWYTKP